MEYQTNSHCKHLIALHLIFVVNYRKQLLKGKVGEFVKNSILEISQQSDFIVEEIEIDKDHVHVLLTISPRYSVSQHVRNIKQITNRHFWERFAMLNKQFWREKTFWSDGYFACSVGNASAEKIQKYIQEHG